MPYWAQPFGVTTKENQTDPPKNKGAEAVSASTPWYSAAPAASAPVADPVVMVDGADPVAVMRRGLDGGGAQHGQGEGGGDQLVHGRSFEGITRRIS